MLHSYLPISVAEHRNYFTMKCKSLHKIIKYFKFSAIKITQQDGSQPDLLYSIVRELSLRKILKIYTAINNWEPYFPFSKGNVQRHMSQQK